MGGLKGTLHGSAKQTEQGLQLDGNGAFLQTEPLSQELREKTLEAWVKLANLDQRGGGAMSVQAIGGARFDAIVFGEQQPGHWLAGSDHFNRTKSFQGPLEKMQQKRSPDRDCLSRRR